MFILATFELLAFAPAFLVPAPNDTRNADSDLSDMQGNWSIAKIESCGRVQPGFTPKERKGRAPKVDLRFIKDKLYFRDELHGSIKLDPARDPKTIDISLGDGNGIQLAIYHFSEARLIIVWDSVERPRPKDFSTRATDPSSLKVLTLERLQPTQGAKDRK